LSKDTDDSVEFSIDALRQQDLRQYGDEMSEKMIETAKKAFYERESKQIELSSKSLEGKLNKTPKFIKIKLNDGDDDEREMERVRYMNHML
jgi:hypothetical protein